MDGKVLSCTQEGVSTYVDGLRPEISPCKSNTFLMNVIILLMEQGGEKYVLHLRVLHLPRGPSHVI